MSKKRKSFHKGKPHRTQRFSREKRKVPEATRCENMILSLLHTATATSTLAEIYEQLPPKRFVKKEVQVALDSLIQDKFVVKKARHRLGLNQNAPLYEGILSQHPKGFGFVKPAGKQSGSPPPLVRDAFVSSANMGAAHHGDTVLVRVLRTRRDDRPEAVVIKILSTGKNRIGGIFVAEGSDRLVYPDDPRFPFTIRIDKNDTFQPQNGDGVIVQFERASQPHRFLPGKIVEILGPVDTVDTQMRLVIEQFNLPHQFEEETLHETERLDSSSPHEQREDLRKIPHVTIDGETAKDFDDAICVVKTRNGYRLYVSIADVSHYVKPGSHIDGEAYERGTSIYFPGRVIPMLPEKLSNDLCSLVPEEDRLTLSAILDFDRTGKRIKQHFTRSVIRSYRRFTYTTVKKILVDKDKTARREHKPFLSQLSWAEELATILLKKRRKRGSIEFNVPEAQFSLTELGKIDSIKPIERNFAHQIVEEFMLAANEAVAELFVDRSSPAIFRVHELPDPVKVQEFLEFTKTLDLPLTPFVNQPSWFADILKSSKGTKYQYIINKLLLRSMQQAHYSAKNVGHFGLAATNYTHFTSPIRRYPDLIVHRELIRLMDKESATNERENRLQSPKEAGEFLSGRERNAVMAERDMNTRLKISYMQDRLGDSFDAIVSGVSENGLYIEILDLMISGLISIDLLDDDYYILDSKNHRLFGEISAKTYQIGDFIRVTLVEVDILSKKLRFKVSSKEE